MPKINNSLLKKKIMNAKEFLSKENQFKDDMSFGYVVNIMEAYLSHNKLSEPPEPTRQGAQGFELKKIEGFTPGPWKFRPDVLDKGFYIETVDMSHRNTYIGDIGGGLQSKYEIKSNAELIAYAPEMYAMLQSFAAQSEGWVKWENGSPDAGQLVWLMEDGGIMLEAFRFYPRGHIGNSYPYLLGMKSKQTISPEETDGWMPLPAPPTIK